MTLKNIYRKLIVVVLFSLLTTLCFSEEMDGIFGIDFGTTKEVVVKKMSADGWSVIEKFNDDSSVCFEKKGETYYGLPVTNVAFIFESGKFWQCVIVFPAGTNIDMAANTIITRYDLMKNYYSYSRIEGLTEYVDIDRKVQFAVMNGNDAVSFNFLTFEQFAN